MHYSNKRSPTITVGKVKYTKINNIHNLSGYIQNQIDSFFDTSTSHIQASPDRKRKNRRFVSQKSIRKNGDNSISRKVSLMNPKKLIYD